LSSAIANAEQKGVSDVDRLFVKSVFVDQGPVLKRFIPRAMGRASRIRKPTSHITVVLDLK
ncbi:MAG: 50S ribosomal protein L22, partial [Alphaproteobacteria bacterium]|nr:50S ribosomal protein L22 [Alphaproteobacteria bacterium]